MTIRKNKPLRHSVLAELNAEQINTVAGGMISSGNTPRPIGHPISGTPIGATPVHGTPVGGRPPFIPL